MTGKYFFTAFLIISLSACSGSSSTPAPEDKPTRPTNNLPENFQDQNGMAQQPFPDSLYSFPGTFEFTNDNYENVINFIFESMQADSVVSFIDELNDVEKAVLNNDAGFTEFQSEFYQRTHSCPNGGQYLADPFGSAEFNDSYRFEDCRLDEFTINGTYFLIAPGELTPDLASVGTVYESLGISISYAAGPRLEFNGSYLLDNQSDNNQHPSSTFTASVGRDEGEFTTVIGGIVYSEEFDQQAIKNLGQGPDKNGNIYAESISINGENKYSFRDIDGTFGVPYLRVKTPTAFTKPIDSAFFTSGQLDITVIDQKFEADNIVVQADNGNPSTFDVILTTVDNAVTTNTLNWSDVQSIAVPREVSYKRTAIFQAQ